MVVPCHLQERLLWEVHGESHGGHFSSASCTTHFSSIGGGKGCIVIFFHSAGDALTVRS